MPPKSLYFLEALISMTWQSSSKATPLRESKADLKKLSISGLTMGYSLLTDLGFFMKKTITTLNGPFSGSPLYWIFAIVLMSFSKSLVFCGVYARPLEKRGLPFATGSTGKLKLIIRLQIKKRGLPSILRLALSTFSRSVF